MIKILKLKFIIIHSSNCYKSILVFSTFDIRLIKILYYNPLMRTFTPSKIIRGEDNNQSFLAIYLIIPKGGGLHKNRPTTLNDHWLQYPISFSSSNSKNFFNDSIFIVDKGEKYTIVLTQIIYNWNICSSFLICSTMN